MPSTREEREAIFLRRIGKDPAQFAVSNDGKVVPRALPETATPPESPVGPWETLGRSAIGGIPETVGSLIGGGLGAAGGTAAGGAMLASPLAPVAPAAPFVGGLAGAIGGGLAGSKLEDEFANRTALGKSYKDFVSKGSEENPIAAELGQALPQLLTANPRGSVRMLKALAQATPTLTRFTGQQLGQLGGIGVGVGTGVAGPVAEDWNRPEGLGLDTAKRAAIRGVAGLLGAQQNRLGNALQGQGFKPSPNPQDRWAGAGRVARDAVQQEARAPIVEGEVVDPSRANTVDADVVDSMGVKEGSPRGLLEDGSGAEVSPVEPASNSVGTQAETDAAMAKAAADLEAAQAAQSAQSQQSNRPPAVDPQFAREEITPRQQAQPESSVLEMTSPEWDELIRNVGGSDYKSDVESGILGLKVEPGEKGELPVGTPLAGKAKLPTDLEKGLVQIAKNAGVDTGPHELLHVILNDVVERGTAGEKAFAKRVMDSAGGEEALVQGGANEFTKRLIDEGGGKTPSLMKDLVSFVKARYLRNATPGDLKRLAARTLRSGAGSEQYRPGDLKSQLPKPSTKEGEQSLKKPNATRTQPLNDTPVPEKPETIAQQLDLTADPKSSKKVTLFVPGTPELPIPPELRTVDIRQGKAVYNPAKVSESEVVRGGSGEQFDGTLLGMSQSVKPRGENVVTTSRGGTPDVVSEVVAPGGEKRAIAAQRAAVPDGETRVTSAEEVVNSRQQPLGPRETYPGEEPKKKFSVWSGPIQRLAESSDPVRQRAADVLNRMFSNRDALKGKYSDVLRKGHENAELFRQGYNAMITRERTGKVPTMPLEVKPFYDIQSKIYEQTRRDQIAAGQTINGRTAGVDPTGMFTIPTREVFDTLTTADKTSPAFKKLKADYVNEQISRGFTSKSALEHFDKYIEGLAHEGDAVSIADFGAVSKAEGTKLPESWIEPDPFKAWERFLDKTATARVLHDVVEKDPQTLALFKGSESLARDPDFGKAWNNFLGRGQMNTTAPIVSGVERVIHAGLLGPATRFIDMATTPLKAFAHTPFQHWPAVAGEMLRAKNYIDAAYKSGLNLPGGDSFVKQTLGAGEYAQGKLNDAANFISTYTGGKHTEMGARVVAQAAGQTLGVIMRQAARAGDKNAARFLNESGTDWAKISDEELGGRIGRLFQGTYDARNLPDWVLNGHYAQFFRLAKWNIEQWNNFVRYGVKPWKEGNKAPLIRQIAVGLGLGGPGIAALRQLLTNKQPYIADLDEIENATDKKAQALAATAKLANAVNAMGTFGIIGSLVEDILIKPATGQLSQGLNVPAVSVATDVGNRSVQAAYALLTGSDPADVMKEYFRDVVKRNVQAVRIATSRSDETKIANLTRDYKMYRRLSGKKDQSPIANIDYSRSSERQMDRADATSGKAKRVELNARAEEKFGRGSEDYWKEMDKLDASRQGFFPSEPQEQRQYMAWLEKTQGKEKALEAKKAYEDWTKQEAGKKTLRAK